jgi:hypothetical protein
MHKVLLTAALLALASGTLSPSAAQEICITPEMISAKAIEQHMSTFYTLHGVDLGYENKVEVIIFEAEDKYLAVAFDAGCFVAHTTLDQEGVEQFINDNTRKAHQ